jgi:hypothetical protein
MTIYFTAPNDEAAAAALTVAPSGEETLTSEISPSSEAFTGLIELVWGKSLDDLKGDQTEQDGVVTTLTAGVARLGGSLAKEIADRDQAELADLAVPWAEGVPSAQADDLVDFLNDLQHLSRHALATGVSVYALETF